MVGRQAAASLTTAAAAAAAVVISHDGYASVMFISALNLLANGFHWYSRCACRAQRYVHSSIEHSASLPLCHVFVSLSVCLFVSFYVSIADTTAGFYLQVRAV